MEFVNKIKNKIDGVKLKRMERDVKRLKSFHTSNALYPEQEKEWFYAKLEKVKKLETQVASNLFRELLPEVEHHPKVKRRVKKQIAKIGRRGFNKTMKDSLYEIMQGYVDEENTGTEHEIRVTQTRALNNRKTAKKEEPKENKAQSNEQKIRKHSDARVNQKRCHFCGTRGHLKNKCTERTKYGNWLGAGRSQVSQ